MKTCRRCHDFEGNAELEAYINNYVHHLNSDVKCKEETYLERLNCCDICDKLINGMCSICGCFVLVRAAKKQMNCPYPYEDKWR